MLSGGTSWRCSLWGLRVAALWLSAFWIWPTATDQGSAFRGIIWASERAAAIGELTQTLRDCLRLISHPLRGNLCGLKIQRPRHSTTLQAVTTQSLRGRLRSMCPQKSDCAVQGLAFAEPSHDDRTLAWYAKGDFRSAQLALSLGLLFS